MTSSPAISEFRQGAVGLLCGAMEMVVLTMVSVAPWVLGAVEAGAEFCLFAGVGVLLLLWGGRMVLEWQLTWHPCWVTLGLGGLFLFGILQIVPLPRPVLEVVSPATGKLYKELLPSEPEQLPSGEGHPACADPAGSSLSLYPAATKRELIRLLAVLLLFAVVRNNLASPAALRRLSVVALVNGFLLALFAFIQFFSSPPQTVYWTMPVLNSPYGPFICRNHFPFYVNMCIGLGVGLLLSLRASGKKGVRPLEGGGQTPLFPDALGPWGGRAGYRHADDEEPWFNPLELFNKPKILWVSLALAFVIAGSAFSLSRGGFISLAVTLCLGLVLKLWLSPSNARLEVPILIGVAAFALVGWYGMDPLNKRLATVVQGEALDDSRLPLWLDMLAVAKKFPLFGTGYGSFADVEAAYRARAENAHWSYDNAHNDYLEALTEGGLARLALSLVVIGVVYRLGWAGLRRYQGQSTQGLIVGALLAFTTVVIHSVVDFGLHIPAIAVLVTVVTAMLSGLGARRDAPARGVETGAGDPAALHFGGVAPVLGLASAVVLGAILCSAGWRQARAYGLQVSARPLDEAADLGGQQRRAELLAEAATTSERADVHVLAGHAYLELYEARKGQAEAAADRDPQDTAEQRWLMPALRHYLQARDLCPLIAKPHVCLAAYAGRMERADSRDTYLRRAKEVGPSNPEVWYLAGALELAEGGPEEAWLSWRRSLELSQEYFTSILTFAAKSLDAQELSDKVVPARAELQFQAAEQLYPRADDERRLPFLKKTRTLLDSSPQPLAPELLHRRAQVEAALGDTTAALASYQAVLLEAPQWTAWRLEYAVLLHRQGRLAEARIELRSVLTDEPDNAAARTLLEQVLNELAGKKN